MRKTGYKVADILYSAFPKESKKELQQWWKEALIRKAQKGDPRFNWSPYDSDYRGIVAAAFKAYPGLLLGECMRLIIDECRRSDDSVTWFAAELMQEIIGENVAEKGMLDLELPMDQDDIVIASPKNLLVCAPENSGAPTLQRFYGGTIEKLAGMIYPEHPGERLMMIEALGQHKAWAAGFSDAATLYLSKAFEPGSVYPARVNHILTIGESVMMLITESGIGIMQLTAQPKSKST